MEKIELVLTSQPSETVMFQKNAIEVVPYVTLEQKIILYQNYIETLFQEKPDGGFDCINYIEAEYALILGLVDMLTNIDIHKVKIDQIIDSGLWNAVYPKIKSYDEIREDLLAIVERMDAKKSIGSVVDNFANKLNMFLDNLSKMDLSADGLDKLTKLFKDTQEQVKVINDVVENPIKIPPVKRKSHIKKE